MKVNIEYEGKKKFIATSGANKIIIDQPKEKGGDDAGMSPLGVFLVSVGSCVAVYAQRYCEGAHIDATGLTVEVNADLSEEKPTMFRTIKVAVHLKSDIGDKKEAFLRFIKNCPIHNTVHNSATVDIAVA